MSNYNISSVQTAYYLVSDGNEENGQNVRTALAHDIDLNDAVVTISPPVDANIMGLITGKAGLYASVSSAESGQYIKWSDEPFEWEIVVTAQGTYEIFIPGKDFYWFDEVDVGIGRSFIIKPGSEATGNEIFFKINEV